MHICYAVVLLFVFAFASGLSKWQCNEGSFFSDKIVATNWMEVKMN